MSEFDVIVVGSGVAGAATSWHLRTQGWRVAMLGQLDIESGYESLSPPAIHNLSSMAIDICVPLPEVIAWWGDRGEHRASPPNAGIVEKKMLVALLRNRVAEMGVQLFTFGGRFELERANGLWSIHDRRCHDQTTLRSPYLVDATGRTSVIGRRLGSTRSSFDSLASISFPIQNPRGIGVWTETTADGWWNACCESTGGTLSFFSSPDVIRQSRKNTDLYFEQASYIRSLFPLAQSTTLVPFTRVCSSSRLSPCAGSGWCAVGDAAWYMKRSRVMGESTTRCKGHNSFHISMS
jgi:flavin-dependent dehydrogenase